MTDVGARWSVGLEQGADGAIRAHALSILGCEEIGGDPEDALDRFSRSLGGMIRELGRIGMTIPAPGVELEITVDEWVATDAEIAKGESIACFDRDRTALLDAERIAGLHLLGDLRGRILSRVRRARNEDLEAIGSPEVNVRSILDDLAQAQWWTLTRLGASPLADVPDGVVARLDTAMALVVQCFADMPADIRGGSVALDGEEWTPRKVLRRLLWLEWSLGDAALHLLESSERASG